MNRRSVHDVAIVGAGMVGAALALALAREGSDVALVESRATPAWRAQDEVDLRVVALASSSIAMFERLGVWNAIRDARACAYARMHVWDALAPGRLDFDAADAGERALGYIVENRLIQHVLWQALQADSRVALHCPAKVASTEVDDEHRALLLDDGSRINARLVVAADGADSALRRLLEIDTRDRDYHQRAIVAHVRTQRAHADTAWQRFVPDATVAFLPLADGRSSIVWAVPNAEAERLLALDDAAFCNELGTAFDFRLGAVTACTARAAFPLRLRLADDYAAPRFALVGDAAHVVHPLAGQGVNLGLRDVQELCAALVETRAAKRDIASDAVLRRYERRRRSDNAIAAHGFDAIQRVFGSGSLPLATLRGLGLSAVDKIAPLKRWFARRAAGQ